MSLKIEKRIVDGVTILDLSGRQTLGEANTLLRDTVREELASGAKNILLNLGEVGYIDSSGLGELGSCLITVSNAGGSLKLFNLAKKPKDLLKVTKIYTIFDVFDDEQVAIRSFSAVPRFFRCPACAEGTVRLRPTGADILDGLYCSGCVARIAVDDSDPNGTTASIKEIFIGGYWSEHTVVVAGSPFRMRIGGRLNLFSSSAVKKAWRVIPEPRRILIDLSALTEVDAAGSDVLTALVSDPGEKGRVSVSLAGLNPELRGKFPETPPFFTSKESALQALGDVSQTPPLIVSVERG
jgi:anti-sigma B factor antagonist